MALHPAQHLQHRLRRRRVTDQSVQAVVVEPQRALHRDDLDVGQPGIAIVGVIAAALMKPTALRSTLDLTAPTEPEKVPAATR
ncbi:hypothetical protein ACFPIJ_63830 [Dactylosporangium cerinum]|uniref:Uncharacterized protein n=1 Tax=Dactylosporangium cerinum TaxID=1434730 RepID=A0ABV9WLY4_9ACTN